jgi:hypothetical protein
MVASRDNMSPVVLSSLRAGAVAGGLPVTCTVLRGF